MQRLLVDVEDFGAEMQRHAAIRPFDHARVRLLDSVAFLVEVHPPPYGVLHFKLKPDDQEQSVKFLC